jgi:NAD+ diphosphatase
LLDKTWYGTIIRAFSIINWDKNHQFCGRCAHPTKQENERFERVCTHCGLIHYPRISPSIIVLIRRDDHLLMARSPHFSPGIFGLIAGFVEPGENLEQAVKREVKEEVNLEIKNLSYFMSQAWPFPDSLMVGFFADYVSGDIRIDPLEIETAGWYRYDQLPELPSIRISISRQLIDHFVKEQQEKHD